MALTYTPDPQIGIDCPEFDLPGTDSKAYKLNDFSEQKVLVVMFICNHCPYVKAIEDRLIALGRSFEKTEVGFVAISSNDAQKYPDDSFDEMKRISSEKEYPFPYLYDESQEIAKAFGAVCTPDFFVYDSDRKLQYRGRLDDNWKEPAKVVNEDLRTSIEDLLGGKPVGGSQKPSMGCSIKWKESP